MSVSAYEHQYVAASLRPLRARPLGAYSAMGIGGGAVVVLLAFVAFSDAPHGVPAEPAPESRALFAPNAPDALNPPVITSESGAKLFPSFDFSPAEFAKEKKIVAIRRLDQGASREESFTFGQFGGDAPFMRLDVKVAAGAKSAASDFFLDMTRHAAQAGLTVAKIGQPSPLQTRFGAFETADIRVSKTGAAGGERSCLALRLTSPKAPVEFAGVACGSAAKPIDRSAMTCVLDRVDYLSNGENKALDEFFLSAELARGQGCSGALSPNGEKANWLDAHAKAPTLKTGVATTPAKAAPPAKAAAPAKKAAAPVKKEKAAH